MLKNRLQTILESEGGGRGRYSGGGRGGGGGGPAISSSTRLAMEHSLLEEAHIVFSTLNSSGHCCMDGMDFRTCIIDGKVCATDLLTPF